MIMNPTARSSKMRAFEALEALLTRTSAIRVKDVDLGLVGEGCEVDIVAHIEVLGHSRTLACQLVSEGETMHVKEALEKLRRGASRLPGDVTPVIVVPCLSQEVRELCQESSAGFLDLHGNGCLAFGEVFISMRSSPSHGVYQSAVASTGAASARSRRMVEDGYPPAHAGSPSHRFRVA